MTVTVYLLQVFGHDKVSVLDGGLPKWVSEGRPTVSGEQPQITPTTFKATYRPHLVRELGQMMDNYHSKNEQVKVYSMLTHNCIYIGVGVLVFGLFVEVS